MSFARPAGTTRFANRSAAKLGLPSAWLDQEFNALYTAINSMTLIQNASEWPIHPTAPTYVAGTQFTLTGDQTAIYAAKRRIRVTVLGVYYYSKVSTSSYSGGTGLTTVTLVDSILTADLTEVSYAIIHSTAAVTSIHAETIPSTAYADLAATNIQDALEELETEKLNCETMGDFVVSGLLGSDPGATRSMTTPAGVCYQSDKRIKSTGFSHTYTASKDTYDSIDMTGTITHTEVANGAAAPALPADSQWLQKVVTDGTEITSVVDLRTVIVPSVSVTTPAASRIPVSRTNGYIDPQWMAQAAQGFSNISLAASVDTNALTIALKTLAAGDPSANDPVEIVFRSATLSSGLYVRRTLTAAASIVLSAGSTLGFAADELGRIYVWAIDNAGTIELALSRTADIFPESNLVTTTAEGGAGAADSAAIMYSASARSNVACRLLGYIEIQTNVATAGNWDEAPSVIQLMGPGVKRTGDIVQTAYSGYSAVATGTTQMPFDDTIPQNTEGDERMTLSITPTSSVNKLFIEVSAWMGNDAATPNSNSMALFQDTTVDALAASSWESGGQYHYNPIYMQHYMTAGTTSATTFKVRCGPSTANTMTFNGYNTARQFSTLNKSYVKITEIFA